MSDATEKKYVNLDGLTYYNTKIKKLIGDSDTTTLNSAKSYADGLAENYDAAGAAATALEDARAYADGKDAAIAAAKQAGEDAKTAAAAAKSAAETADGKADAAKEAVDNLKTFVGTLPEGETSASVVAYIDKKTAGIASESALTSLTTRVTTAEDKITAAEGEIDTLQTGMEAAEGKIDTLINTDIGKSVRDIANDELTKQLIPENAADSLDTLQEIAAWIQAHPGDASAMNQAITALQTLVGTLPEGITATTVVGYVQELVAAEKTRATSAEEVLDGRIDNLETAIGTGGAIETKVADAKKEAINTAAADATTKAGKALEDAKSYTDTEIENVNTALEGKAAQTALDAVSGRVTTAEGKIKTLEGASHTHDNKADLDGISATLIARWNDAYEKAHAHTNKKVLDGITSEKITAWDSAEQKAKAYTDTKIGEFAPIANADIDNMFV